MGRLDELLNIKYPVIQGGMAHISTGGFAASCSNAGILGTVASGSLSASETKEQIKICRGKTKNPFAVNLIMNHPHLDEIIDVVISMDVPVVVVGNGNALKVIRQMKDHGRTVIPVLSSPEFAGFYQRAGADAIIAEGCESGGHIGSMTTMVLVPQVCDIVSIPVVCAGGIADNRQFKAAFSLGASGVQVGTALLASKECPVHEKYKEAIIKSRSSSSVVTGEILGDNVRVIQNSLTKKYFELEKEKNFVGMKGLLTGSYERAAVSGDVDYGSVMAGQVCGQIHAIRPLADIIKGICNGDK